MKKRRRNQRTQMKHRKIKSNIRCETLNAGLNAGIRSFTTSTPQKEIKR